MRPAHLQGGGLTAATILANASHFTLFGYDQGISSDLLSNVDLIKTLNNADSVVQGHPTGTKADSIRRVPTD
jgi:hypothetical protein